MCFICGKKQHLSLLLQGNVVGGDRPGAETLVERPGGWARISIMQ